jgi:hypothetical protein
MSRCFVPSVSGMKLIYFKSIEIATRAADAFTRVYYTTYDSPTRVDDLPQFYRSSSTLTWNGNPCQGAEGVKKLIEDMPTTKHEVQSYDCHPIPGLFVVSYITVTETLTLPYRLSAPLTSCYCLWKRHTWTRPCW